jgi:hypothetical protein
MALVPIYITEARFEVMPVGSMSGGDETRRASEKAYFGVDEVKQCWMWLREWRVVEMFMLSVRV